MDSAITSALASLWAACGSEWAAMGEAGQAMALAWFGVTVLLACLVAVVCGSSNTKAEPDEHENVKRDRAQNEY